jgi:hypothetical protein
MHNRPVRPFSEAFYPDDLSALQSVFDCLCGEFHVLPDTSDAHEIAWELIRLFQTGMADEDMLKIAMRARWQKDWKVAG